MIMITPEFITTYNECIAPTLKEMFQKHPPPRPEMCLKRCLGLSSISRL